MVKQYLATTILIALTLTACVMKSGPSSKESPLESSTSHSSPSSSSAEKNPSESSSTSSECPQSITLKIDGKVVPVTAPNPFQGFTNPGLRIQGDSFIVELSTEEAGLFELLDFDANNLGAGTFEGDKFQLKLSYSPYTRVDCTNVNYRRESKLIIEEYATTERKFAGCFYGKLDCDGKVLEVNAPLSGTVY